MQDRRTLKVPTTANQGQAICQCAAFAVPKLDYRVGPCNPLTISFVDIDRNIAKRMAPFHDATVIMWVRKCHCRYIANRLNSLNGCIINQGNAIPQHIKVRRLYKMGTLPQGNLWL